VHVKVSPKGYLQREIYDDYCHTSNTRLPAGLAGVTELIMGLLLQGIHGEWRRIFRQNPAG